MLAANVVKSMLGFAAFAAMHALRMEANGEVVTTPTSLQGSAGLSQPLDGEPLVFEPLNLTMNAAHSAPIVRVSQAGRSNELDLRQSGETFAATASILQSGKRLTARILQEGPDSHIDIEQSGAHNLLALTQSGGGNLLQAEQTGQGLSLEINQSGGSAIIVRQWNY